MRCSRSRTSRDSILQDGGASRGDRGWSSRRCWSRRASPRRRRSPKADQLRERRLAAARQVAGHEQRLTAMAGRKTSLKAELSTGCSGRDALREVDVAQPHAAAGEREAVSIVAPASSGIASVRTTRAWRRAIASATFDRVVRQERGSGGCPRGLDEGEERYGASRSPRDAAVPPRRDAVGTPREPAPSRHAARARTRADGSRTHSRASAPTPARWSERRRRAASRRAMAVRRQRCATDAKKSGTSSRRGAQVEMARAGRSSSGEASDAREAPTKGLAVSESSAGAAHERLADEGARSWSSIEAKQGHAGAAASLGAREQRIGATPPP